MNKHHADSPQMDLAFGDAAHPPVPQPAPPRRARRKPAPVLSPHDMAQALDAHPDYRVLRRLVPVLDFGPAPVGADLAQVLVLDTETTGLDAAQDRVIELALLRVAVDRRSGQPVGPVQVYDGLEDPGRPLPPEIVKITGITDAMLAGQRLDEARVAQLLHGVDLVVAHNAAFDRPFVEARCPAFADLAWACSWADLDWKALGQGSAKLESLALGLGLFYDAHRAETDCHALLTVLRQPASAFMAAGAAGPNGATGAAGATGPNVATGAVGATVAAGAAAPASGQTPTLLAALLEAAQQPQYRLQATGAPFEAKDALKARGYRWDANQRVWGTVLRSDAALQAELRWLADAVYAGRAVRVPVETLDARHRHSLRRGEVALRPVGGGPDGLDAEGLGHVAAHRGDEGREGL